jgi:hypothetical protein
MSRVLNAASEAQALAADRLRRVFGHQPALSGDFSTAAGATKLASRHVALVDEREPAMPDLRPITPLLPRMTCFSTGAGFGATPKPPQSGSHRGRPGFKVRPLAARGANMTPARCPIAAGHLRQASLARNCLSCGQE